MVKKIYTDGDNELETYVSTENKSFIQVGQLGEDYYFSGCIELDAADLEELINDLQNQLTNIKQTNNENTGTN
jgi:hypothetical protein